MAITGIVWPTANYTLSQSFVGPVEAEGFYWAFFPDSTDSSKLIAIQSVDGTTWTRVDEAGSPNVTANIGSVWVDVDGTTAHVVTQEDANPGPVHYHAFDLTTGTWTTTNDLVASPATTFDQWQCSGEPSVITLTYGTAVRVVKRSTDLVIVYQSSGSAQGTAYGRVDFARGTAGAWTTGTVQAAAANQNWTPGSCTLDSSGVLQVHCYSNFQGFNAWNMRSYSTGNVWSTAVTVDNAGNNAGRGPSGSGTTYTVGTAEHIFTGSGYWVADYESVTSPPAPTLERSMRFGGNPGNELNALTWQPWALTVSGTPYMLIATDINNTSFPNRWEGGVHVTYKTACGTWEVYTYRSRTNGYRRLSAAAVSGSFGFFTQHQTSGDIEFWTEAPPSGPFQTVRPSANGATGSWSPFSYVNVDETCPDDIDYVESDQAAAGSSSTQCEHLLAAASAPTSDLNHYVEVTGQIFGGDGSGMQIAADLYEGATRIAQLSYSVDSLDNGVSADPFDHAILVLTEAEAGAITDYSNLRVRYQYQNGGGSRDGKGRVGWAAVKLPTAAGNLFRWDGTAWVSVPTVKVWDGTGWTAKPMFRWDGSAWQPVT